MSVHLIIMTHEHVGDALVSAATTALNGLPLTPDIITVPIDTNIDQLSQQLAHIIRQHQFGDGILVLTDLFGATPSNLAVRFQCQGVRVISGLNLPMLIRIMNYAQLGLNELAEKALTGGKDGVVNCASFHEDAA